MQSALYFCGCADDAGNNPDAPPELYEEFDDPEEHHDDSCYVTGVVTFTVCLAATSLDEFDMQARDKYVRLVAKRLKVEREVRLSMSLLSVSAQLAVASPR